jgi:hypothetical protein
MVAVIRDPAERFISAINYRHRGGTKPLDVAMREAHAKIGRDVVFTPQSVYVDEPDEPHERRLFRFENIGDAFKYLGVEPQHENRQEKRWAADEITAHPLFEDCMAGFESDFELRAT